ncbi:MAG: hypothetical protein Q8O38_07315 [Sulfurimicrobium sp.]|nr:hypothetical protein [Sulfurimicrobium sp.]
MNTSIETSILEHLHRLDERRKAEVLDFVEYLATKSNAASITVSWPNLDPERDLARFQGVLQFDEDAVAYQRRIRDSEWT